MARVSPIELGESEREGLRAIIKKGADWRERERAETILLLAAGHSVQSVAKAQGLCREAVLIRRPKWLQWGLASLLDRPRRGAPSNLTEEQRRQLGMWVESEALSTRELLTRLEREYQVVIGRTTFRMELQRLGYAWKRTRYSLKKNGTRSGSSGPAATSKT